MATTTFRLIYLACQHIVKCCTCSLTIYHVASVIVNMFKHINRMLIDISAAAVYQLRLVSVNLSMNLSTRFYDVDCSSFLIAWEITVVMSSYNFSLDIEIVYQWFPTWGVDTHRGRQMQIRGMSDYFPGRSTKIRNLLPNVCPRFDQLRCGCQRFNHELAEWYRTRTRLGTPECV